MRPRRTLPSSKFRLVAVATFAALAISPTVLGLNSNDDPRSVAPPSTTAPAPTNAGIPGAPGADETEVTTRTPSATSDEPTASTVATTAPTSTESVASDLAVGVGVDVLAIDAPPAPVSGQPVVVGDPDDSGELACPIEAPTDTVSASEPPNAPPNAPASEPATVPADDAVPDSSVPNSESDASTTIETTIEPAMTPGPATGPDESAVNATGADMTVVSFDSGAPGWVPLSGSWSVVGGEYVQGDPTGYDFITQYPGDLPAEYAVSIRLRADDGTLGGGVMVAQPVPGSRRGATLIDFTDGGRFLRWGRYDADSGQYQYVGGVAMGDAFDTAASHRLTVEVRAGRTLVVVDGAAVGEFGPVGPGRIGLATSLSAVAFDDLEIVTL